MQEHVAVPPRPPFSLPSLRAPAAPFAPQSLAASAAFLPRSAFISASVMAVAEAADRDNATATRAAKRMFDIAYSPSPPKRKGWGPVEMSGTVGFHPRRDDWLKRPKASTS